MRRRVKQAEIKALHQRDPALLQEIARNPESAPELLAGVYDLLKDAVESIAPALQQELGAQLAQNPSTPVGVLRCLSYDHPDEFFRNPVLPLLLLEDPRFFDDLHGETLCTSPEAPALYLQSVAQARYPDYRELVVMHPNCSHELLCSLFTAPEERLRRIIARRLLASVPIDWRALLGCTSVDVRLLMLQHPDCPREVLARVVNDTRPLVRASLARQHHTPAEILERLSYDRAPMVRQAVAENTMTPPSTRVRLREDASGQVKRAARRFPERLQGQPISLREVAHQGFGHEATEANQRQLDRAVPTEKMSTERYYYERGWGNEPEFDFEDMVLDPRDIDAHLLHRKRAPKTDPAKRKKP